MSLDADAIVDRRRMRRKLTFWRVAALLIVLVAVGRGRLSSLTRRRPALDRSGDAARLPASPSQGLIRGDQDRVEALERLGKSNATAVIVHINSPGGTTAGSEQLYDALRAAEGARSRWSWWSTGSPASGGYIAAMACRSYRRAARRSLVGSIGVLFQYPELHRPARRPSASRSKRSNPRRSRPRRTASSRPARRRARRSRPSSGLLCLVQGPGERDRRRLDDAAAGQGGRRPRVYRPPGRCALKLVDELGDERTGAGLAGEGKEASTARRRCATIGCEPAVQRSAVPARRRRGRLAGCRWAWAALRRSVGRGSWGAVQAVERTQP